MITVERQFPSGAWEVSAFVSHCGETWLHTRVFYGYTKREAVRIYRDSCATQGYVFA